MKAPEQNSTIEPMLAALGNGGPGEELSAGTGDGDDSELSEESQREKAGEWIRAVSARMAAIRAEKPGELNVDSRREAQQTNARRRARRDWHKNRKRADRANERAARAEPSMTGTNAARTVSDSADLVNAGEGPTPRAAPAYV
jgi:hypothetical protein